MKVRPPLVHSKHMICITNGGDGGEKQCKGGLSQRGSKGNLKHQNRPQHWISWAYSKREDSVPVIILVKRSVGERVYSRMSAQILPFSTYLIYKKCTLYPAETSRFSTTVVLEFQGVTTILWQRVKWWEGNFRGCWRHFSFVWCGNIRLIWNGKMEMVCLTGWTAANESGHLALGAIKLLCLEMENTKLNACICCASELV